MRRGIFTSLVFFVITGGASTWLVLTYQPPEQKKLFCFVLEEIETGRQQRQLTEQIQAFIQKFQTDFLVNQPRYQSDFQQEFERRLKEQMFYDQLAARRQKEYAEFAQKVRDRLDDGSGTQL